MLDALDSGVAVLDELGRITIWNAWLASASGIDPGAAVGRRFAELFPQARLTRLEQAIDDGLTLGASSLLTHSLHPNILPLRTRAGRGLIHDLAVRPVGA